MAEETKEAAPPADAGAGAAPEASGGAGNGKLVFILTIVNLLVTVGIAGVLAISFKKEKSKVTVSDVADSAQHEEAAAEHGEKKEEGGGHGGGGGGGGHGGGGGGGGHGGGGAPAKKLTQYGKMLTLEQFTVNLANAGTVNPKYIRVNISIEVPTDELETELTQKMPRVRNIVIDLFNAKRISDVSTSEGRDFLKDEIKNALNSFLVSGKIKGVFFTNFTLSG